MIPQFENAMSGAAQLEAMAPVGAAPSPGAMPLMTSGGVTMSAPGSALDASAFGVESPRDAPALLGGEVPEQAAVPAGPMSGAQQKHAQRIFGETMAHSGRVPKDPAEKLAIARPKSPPRTRCPPAPRPVSPAPPAQWRPAARPSASPPSLRGLSWAEASGRC